MNDRITRRGLGTLLRRRDGAAALEFALVSVPLFWVIFAILEFGAMYMVQTNLDAALAETGRRIRTGEVQTLGLSRADLEAEICDNLNSIMAMECTDKLFLDVDRFDTFDEVANGSPSVGGVVDRTQMSFQPGIGDEIILVRAYYQWELLTPMFGALFANLQNRERLMISAMLFRNEPF